MRTLDFSHQGTRLAVTGTFVAAGALATAILPPGAALLPFVAAVAGFFGNVGASDAHQKWSGRLSRSP